MHAITLLILPIFATSAAAAQADPVDISTARSSLAGQWEGKTGISRLWRKQWFGIPVKTRIEDQGDRATVIRRSDFDDGPTTGNVRITSVELFDPAKSVLTVGTFRKGRAVEVMDYRLRIEGTAKDPTHWTMVEEATGKDDDRPALLRLTTTRDGDRIETVKQIDFQDDDKTDWITRNRTRLTRVSN